MIPFSRGTDEVPHDFIKQQGFYSKEKTTHEVDVRGLQEEDGRGGEEIQDRSVFC